MMDWETSAREWTIKAPDGAATAPHPFYTYLLKVSESPSKPSCVCDIKSRAVRSMMLAIIEEDSDFLQAPVLAELARIWVMSIGSDFRDTSPAIALEHWQYRYGIQRYGRAWTYQDCVSEMLSCKLLKRLNLNFEKRCTVVRHIARATYKSYFAKLAETRLKDHFRKHDQSISYNYRVNKNKWDETTSSQLKNNISEAERLMIECLDFSKFDFSYLVDTLGPEMRAVLQSFELSGKTRVSVAAQACRADLENFCKALTQIGVGGAMRQNVMGFSGTLLSANFSATVEDIGKGNIAVAKVKDTLGTGLGMALGIALLPVLPFAAILTAGSEPDNKGKRRR